LGQRRLVMNKWLSRARIPFMIAIAFIFVVEIIMSIIRPTVPPDRVGLASSLNIFVYIAISLAFLAFFTVTVVRLIKRLTGNSNIHDLRGKSTVVKLIVFYVVTSIGLLHFVAACIFLVTDLSSDPFPYSIMWFNMFIGMTTVSLGHLLTYVINTNVEGSSLAPSPRSPAVRCSLLHCPTSKLLSLRFLFLKKITK
jgi:amino acid transporter